MFGRGETNVRVGGNVQSQHEALGVDGLLAVSYTRPDRHLSRLYSMLSSRASFFFGTRAARSSAGQGKFASQSSTFYHCATPPTTVSCRY